MRGKKRTVSEFPLFEGARIGWRRLSEGARQEVLKAMRSALLVIIKTEEDPGKEKRKDAGTRED
jgi:hypothetical protein